MIRPWMTKSPAVLSMVVLSIVSVVLSSEAQAAPPYRVKQGSWLLKHQGCGYNPEGCTWCTSRRCYMVDGCKDGWCNVWYSRPDPSTNKPRPGQVGPVSVGPTAPPKKTGPGTLKDPPTTVSNPNAPTQPPPQIRARHK